MGKHIYKSGDLIRVKPNGSIGTVIKIDDKTGRVVIELQMPRGKTKTVKYPPNTIKPYVEGDDGDEPTAAAFDRGF